ncbi:MAG: 2-dehydro-3-deoxyphosphogluconate aldolase/(4S)-4-hydroxy-2-oxoglutarate aldolase [Desulforhopalus sp.]|jgi:2-dehydro-3-deoxyphosphogluconate aldolase/(4S)-4-hydroxy-2-oxoglutarate aldolase
MNDKRQNEIKKQLTQLKLVPVVALPSVDAGLRLAEILIGCNLPVAEVTFRTPCAAEAIAAMKRDFSEILVLAGTVLSIKQADIARDAGAECIVIPGFHNELVAYCQDQNMMVCPGTATPTEVIQCMNMGINTVKFFPAEVAGGVGMLKSMAAVFEDVQFMPTGGISPDNMLDYLALSSVFCCGGSWLAPESMMLEGRWREIEARISSAVSLINS